MYRVTRRLLFSYGHRLLNHQGKCAHLHGHNAGVRVTLESETLGPTGMVVDFDSIEDQAGKWMADNLDHRMILSRNDPAVAALRSIGEEPYLVDFDPTAENLCRHIFHALASSGLPVVEVVFEETENCAAAYRPDRERSSH